MNARIWNLGGFDATPTAVTFTYIEPGLAIPVLVPQPINSVPVFVNVPAGGYAVASAPWTPPSVVGDVHTCLIATCSCPMTGDTPATPGNAVADRHTGQRNVAIIGAAAKQTIHFRLAMTNLLPEAADVSLGARALWLTPREPLKGYHQFDPLATKGAVRALAQPNSLTRYQLLGRRAVMLSDQAEAFEATELEYSQVRALVAVNRVAPGHRLDRGTIVPVRGRVSGSSGAIGAIGEPVHLRALQQAHIEGVVTLPRSDEDRAFFVLHLFQVTGGAVDGGYSFVRSAGARERPRRETAEERPRKARKSR
ncbi:MAG TPA: hypothetical protein VFE63_17320 [Roseiarcus sp.]|nr:hypothetical protein [Roseiarcus sp.]